MADWTRPLLSDLKVDVLDMLKLRDVDAITLSEAPTSPPVGAVRWNRTTKTFQSWDGAVWQTMIIAMVGGGTGAQTPGEITAGLGIKTMAYQESNAVAISGGSITGLSNLGSSGNITAMGVYVAGSGGVTLTNSVGYILESSIADGNVYPRLIGNETISGSWTFNGPVAFNGNFTVTAQAVFSPSILIAGTSPAIWFTDNDATGTNRSTIIFALAENFAIRAYSDNFGTSQPLLSSNRSGLTWLDTLTYGTWTFTRPLSVSTATDAEAVVNVIGPGGGGIHFWAGAAAQGKIFAVTPGALYNDCTTNYWRTLNGSALRASLDAGGAFVTQGGITAGSGYYRNPQGATALYASAGIVYTLADTFSFYNYAGTEVVGKITSGGYLTLPRSDSVLTVGGEPGVGVRLYKQAGSVFMCGPNIGSNFEWYTGDGSTRLAYLHTSSGFAPMHGITIPAGTQDIPSIRFGAGANNATGSGIYFNNANGTAEFGCRFSLNTRGIMRCWNTMPASTGKVDFICGNNVPLTLTESSIIVGQPGVLSFNFQMAASPIGGADNTYTVGTAGVRWVYVYSVNGVITGSDIRLKRNIRDIPNALELLDVVSPIICSWENSDELFPSFSAQEISEQIDARYGTSITEYNEEFDRWGLNYSRLLPVMWQIIKNLHAKVKTLEEN